MAEDPRRDALIRLRGRAQQRRDENVDMNTYEPIPAVATVIKANAKPQPQEMHPKPQRPPRQTNGSPSRLAPMVLQHSAIRTDVQLMHPHQKQRLYPQQHAAKNEIYSEKAALTPESRPQTKEDGHPAVDSYEIQRERQRIMQQRYAEVQEAKGRTVKRSADSAFLTSVRSMPHQTDEDYVLAENNSSDDDNNQTSGYPIHHEPPSINSSKLPRKQLTESNQLLDAFHTKFWSDFYEQEHEQERVETEDGDAYNEDQEEREQSAYYQQSSRDPQPSAHFRELSRSNSDLSRATEPDDTQGRGSHQCPPRPNRSSHDRGRTKTKTRPLPQPSNDTTTIFSSRSAVFVVACVALGISGFFFEELLEVGNRLVETTPFVLSRREQQELTRRLDALQQEFNEFRTTRDHVESQSQRLVHEVQEHLERIKRERERHQQMILEDMEAMRTYVQRMTEELVEQEKKAIRQRLMETIAASLPHIEEIPEEELEVPLKTSASDAVINGASIPQAIADRTPVKETEGHEPFVSWQVVLMLLAVTLLAGMVGLRVRNMNRRKQWLQNRQTRRRSHQWQQHTTALDEDDMVVDDATKQSDDLTRTGSGVETAFYMADRDTDERTADNDHEVAQGDTHDETERESYDHASASPRLDDKSSNQHEASFEFAATTSSFASVPAMGFRHRTSQSHEDSEYIRRSPRFHQVQRSPLSTMR